MNQPILSWLKQIGTPHRRDEARAIATDQWGNVFICGTTTGELEVGQEKGQFDAFLAKYNPVGEQVWLKQMGTSKWDEALAIATDQWGNVFICGTTRGELEAGQKRGDWDVFLAKYNPAGEQTWLKQIGTSSVDTAQAITTDQWGNVFICGKTKGELETGQARSSSDAFLAKYNPAGEQVWLKQMGTSEWDEAHAIATDQWGNVFICGYTTGEFETGQARSNSDAFLAKYNPVGEQLWLKQIGTSSTDKARAIATDQLGNVFICGTTIGALETGQGNSFFDAFLAKYNPAGEQTWLKQFGSSSEDKALAIATDQWGNVFICGYTTGELETGQAKGREDAFLAKYNPAGEQTWLKQIGSSSLDIAEAITTDQWGNVFICGTTIGALETGQGNSFFDAFLAKYNDDLSVTQHHLLTQTKLEQMSNDIIKKEYLIPKLEQLSKMNQPILSWLKQFGTSSINIAQAIATDQWGNVFICGTTDGELEAGQGKEGQDNFLAKYNPRGEQTWLKQFGTTSEAEVLAIATDQWGNVFICGSTTGEFETGQAKGRKDAFLAKYNPAGEQTWLKQTGTSSMDEALGIATDQWGNVFICGTTTGELEAGQAKEEQDVFLAKYNPIGEQTWLKQIGTSSTDKALGIATDQWGNVFICGYTEGNLETGQARSSWDWDVFLAKYNPTGEQLWLKQIGTSSWDSAQAIATDQLGNVFICGFTEEDLEAGQAKGATDAFLAKYNPIGKQLWLKQIGTSSQDSAQAIATDQWGNVFICGTTTGELEAGQAKEEQDVFLAKYNPIGEQTWLKQFGTSSEDKALAVATDQWGNIFISGSIEGELEAGQTKEDYDAFLAKYIDDLSATQNHLLMQTKLEQLSNEFIKKEYLIPKLEQLSNDILELKDQQLSQDLDLSLIQLAKASIKGRKGNKISQAEAKRIVTKAQDSKKIINEAGKKTIAFIYSKYPLTDGASKILIKALSSKLMT